MLMATEGDLAYYAGTDVTQRKFNFGNPPIPARGDAATARLAFCTIFRGYPAYQNEQEVRPVRSSDSTPAWR